MSLQQQKRLHDALHAAIDECAEGMPVAEVYGVLEVVKFGIHEGLVQASRKSKPGPTIVTPEGGNGGG